MAGKKKTSKKDELVDDIPEEMVADIQDAVAAEDKPRTKSGAISIPITHWEEDPVDDADQSDTDIPAVDSISDADDEPTVESENEDKDIDVEAANDDVEENLAAVDIEVEDDDDMYASDSDTEDEEHAWHEIDESEEDDDTDEVAETESTDEAEEPAHAVKSEQVEEEDEERPEWDEEKWQQANLDEEEPERLEWDEEKWQHSEQDDDAVDAQNDEEPTTTAETAVAVATTTSQLTDDDSETESIDQQSAAQAALNNDEIKSQKRFSFKAIFGRFGDWWQSAKLRHSIIISAAVLLLIVITVPAPRYAALNVAGVRAQASVAIVDAETQLPLRDVNVKIGGVDGQTNELGIVDLSGVRLGSQDLIVTKSAFDTYSQRVNVGMGKNSYNVVNLVGIGSRFEFRIADWLTDAPLSRAEVIYQENSAYTDDNGVAVLNVPNNSETTITVSITAPNYAQKDVEIDTTSSQQTEVGMVLGRFHMFVSERDGTYDVYRILADGTDEELILKGTGNERDGLRFDTSPSGRYSVLVATRDSGIRNPDGFVLSGLYLIPTNGDELTKIDSSERIDLIGWIGERIIYVKVQAGASGQNPERHRLMSLDVASGETTQIAASNYFNDVLLAKDYVFYAPSDAYKQNPQAYLFRSNADGSAIDTVFQGEVWTILRTDYDNIAFDSNQVWYTGRIDSILNRESDSPPTTFTSRLYSPNPSNSRAAWVDIRDGKGTLIVADTENGEEEILLRLGGLRSPLVWLSDTHLIFRVVTSDETADYVINVESGDPRKITDVTDVSGVDRWYYYY